MQVKGHGKGHKVNYLGAICKGFISLVCLPDMKSLSLMVQKLWPRLKFLPHKDRQKHRQTGQKLDAPEWKHKKKQIAFV